MRRELMEAGEDPDHLELTEREQALVELGAQIAKDAHLVGDELYSRVAAFLTEDQVVELMTFAGLMIATNVFCDALQIEFEADNTAFRAAT